MTSSNPTYLVLIAGMFPGLSGDYSFIRHEIDTLAARFDHVLVFSFRRIDGPMARLPENVTYAGALSNTRKAEIVLALLQPRYVAAAVSSFLRELRSGRTRGHLGLTIGNILTGIRFAFSIEGALSTAGVGRESRVSVYSFWGSHGALALPFVSPRYRRIMRLHRFDLYEGLGGRLPLRASLFDASDSLLPISEDGRAYLEERFGALIAPGKLEVLRLGTADHGLGPVPLTSHGAGNPIRVVSCSSVIDVKRVDTIVPALELLAASHDIRWTHFGSGVNMPALETAARNATESCPRLEIDLRGQTDNSALLDYYRTHPVDVFVNVSDSEGVPVSIMEAFSFGIPVVATDVGGTGEIVSEELCSGILLPPRPTDAALATALLAVATRRSTLDPRGVWKRFSDAHTSAERIARALEYR